MTPREMKFRDDIDLEKTWIVSDTHFGHDNIVGFCHRPEDHEQIMIAEWRKVIPDDATVLHLGDLSYRSNAFFKHIVAKELTGARKLLIKGNHDRQSRSFYIQAGFYFAMPFMIGVESAADGSGLRALGQAASWNISFSHYPWNGFEQAGPMPHNHIRIHGHIHNNGYTRNGYVPFLKNHINMSVEQTKYQPVNLKLLLDAYILGKYDETTQDQLDEARIRKTVNLRGELDVEPLGKMGPIT